MKNKKTALLISIYDGIDSFNNIKEQLFYSNLTNLNKIYIISKEDLRNINFKDQINLNIDTEYMINHVNNLSLNLNMMYGFHNLINLGYDNLLYLNSNTSIEINWFQNLWENYLQNPQDKKLLKN